MAEIDSGCEKGLVNMSTEIIKDILCPQCGESQQHRILSSIHAAEQPDQKDAILREVFFDWTCVHCDYTAAMAYPFLYIDREKEYVICLAPVGNTESIEPSGAMGTKKKRMVKNLSEMKEKILIFDAGYDDVCMELVKSALCSIIKKTYKVNRLHAYFSRENEGELEFAIFLPGKDAPVYHSTKTEVYFQSQEVLRALAYQEPQKEFLRVDARLSRKLLEQYQNI